MVGFGGQGYDVGKWVDTEYSYVLSIQVKGEPRIVVNEVGNP